MSTLVALVILIGIAPRTDVLVRDTVFALPEMTVTATRLEADVNEIGQRIERIDRQAIARSGSHSLADVLSRGSSVYVRRYGPSGMASLSLRGTGASQTAILLDGRRIGDPQLGQLDLTLLPVDMLSSVEVLHGAASAVHGSDGLGGAVNLRTDSPEPGGLGTVRLGAGEYGERELAARATFGNAARGLTFAGRMQSAENDYPYFSRALGQQIRLEGASREQASVFAAAHARRDDTSMRLSAMMTTSRRDLPAGSGIPSFESQDDDAVRAWMDIRHRLGRGHVKFGGLVQRAEIRYRNALLGLDDPGTTTIATADVEAGTRLGLWNVVAGTELGTTSARHPSIGAIDPESRLAMFVQGHGPASLGPIGQPWMYPAVRVDRYRARGRDGAMQITTALSPSLGMNLPLSSVVRARASVGRGFRMPTFNDRFWSPGGNPDLRPERGWTADGALIVAAGAHRADVTLFMLETRDQIVWSPVTSTLWTPSNLARTRVRGIETSAQTAVPLGNARLEARMSYRLADARDRSSRESATFDMPIRYRPRHVGSAALGFERGDFVLDLGATFTGRNYTTDDGTRWLDPHAVVNAGVSYGLGVGFARITSSARVENLFDARYVVVENNPMPPRHLRLSLTLESNHGR